MDVRHDDDDLATMESDADFNGPFSAQIGRAFRKVMNLIRQIPHEAALAQFRGLRSEKLQGARDHQWSLRLNDQWRLIYEIEKRDGGNRFIVKAIEDYHR